MPLRSPSSTAKKRNSEGKATSSTTHTVEGSPPPKRLKANSHPTPAVGKSKKRSPFFETVVKLLPSNDLNVAFVELLVPNTMNQAYGFHPLKVLLQEFPQEALDKFALVACLFMRDPNYPDQDVVMYQEPDSTGSTYYRKVLILFKNEEQSIMMRYSPSLPVI